LIKTNILKYRKYNEAQTTHSLKHFPVSTREWNNSIYAFNKNSLNLIPIASLSASKIIKSYFELFNFNIEKNLRTQKLSVRRRRKSKNKIFIGNTEFKHTNNKVVVNLYLFNRQEKSFFIMLKKKYNRWKKLKLFQKRKKNYLQKKIGVKNNIKYNFRKNIFFKRGRKIKKIKSNKKIDWKAYNIYFYKKINYLFNKLDKFTSEYEKNKVFLLFILDRKYLDKCSKDLALKISKSLKIVSSNETLRKKKKKFFKLPLNKQTFKNIDEFSIKDKVKMKRLHKLYNLWKKTDKQTIILKKDFLSKLDTYFIKFKNTIRDRYLEKLESYFYYRQLIYINKTKFNYNFLQLLKEELENVFNKNVEFNLIKLKRFYFSSDILSESIKMKLSKNRRRIFKHLNKLKNKVKIRIKNPLLFKPSLSNKANKIFSKKYLQKVTINNIKYKDVTGFRIEARGRLTRRNTASRSVTKVKYKGNLLNLDSSHRRLSSIMLKGNLESNLQFTKSNSKTRIGSYGLKGWVSAN
jgi:hypothetical protein